ncbi:hypothetical protein DL770_004040 [Monosporascus sp. CRB-9-2]|nr:hypothetical protein DL770_004040 [Monosporascus sp. CRB-9-2]
MAANTVRTSGGISHFQQHSSEYEKFAGKTSTRLAAAALSALPLSTYGASSHFLDSACGPGIVTKLLLSPSPEYVDVPGLPINPPPRVTGIDIAPSMVAQFTANISTYGWRTAEGFVQDSGDLSRFKDGEFDAVVMNLVLKPGGYAVITTWKERRAAGLLQSVVAAIHPGSDKKPMYLDPAWETRKKLEEVMKAGGFSVDIRESAVHWVNDSVEDVVEALSSPMWTAKIWQDWSAEETARWKDEIARQLTEQERATATLAMTGWICVARKPQA